MKTKANLFSIPLSDIEASKIYALRSVSPVFKYVNREKTDTIIAYRYSVVNTESYEALDVKVPHTKPLVTQETIDTLDTCIKVTLKNAIVTPYAIAYGIADCSVVAEDIQTVKE